ncbi:MAG: DUF503 domain-containing protein [Thermodesulfobacteriota bacterium]
MVIGICHIDLFIHHSNSLKGKRKVLKTILERAKNRFNVSVAEVGDHDLWQRSKIGVCTIGNENAYVNSVLDKILNFIESLNVAEVVNHRIEIANF